MNDTHRGVLAETEKTMRELAIKEASSAISALAAGIINSAYTKSPSLEVAGHIVVQAQLISELASDLTNL